MGTGRPHGDDLGGWLAANGFEPAQGPGTIADTALVRSLLVAAARDGRALSYSELLRALGHRFTRPKMRALCKTLDAIDADGATRGEPGLAVLVVRESDGLPGQGWWIGTSDRGYTGAWEGAEAAAHIAALQSAVFRFWAAEHPERHRAPAR
ncbi:ribose-phosphate pyrophosphokinase [Sphingomonas sp. XXL09]|uniref:ribose-phosphate pyrophosphokinase n=1 Tax=Sphingomonas sp. XXL09 TaxID=3457787 RepID=UPI00406BB152